MNSGQKIGQGPPPPHLDKIQKKSNFFLVIPSLKLKKMEIEN